MCQYSRLSEQTKKLTPEEKDLPQSSLMSKEIIAEGLSEDERTETYNDLDTEITIHRNEIEENSMKEEKIKKKNTRAIDNYIQIWELLIAIVRKMINHGK